MAPYEQAFRDEGDLCFYAELPGLAHIGERFAELSESCLNYSAPAEELEAWRRLAEHLTNLIPRAARDDCPAWPEIRQGLERDFGQAYVEATQRLPDVIDEYFDTKQMPLSEYLEWILHGAETAWSLNSGPGGGPDMDTYQARLDKLTERLQTAGYEAEADRRMRDQDPERYAFMAKSLESLQRAMQDPNPASFQDAMAEQMELFKQSSMFEQAQQQMQQMREQLLANPDSDPDVIKFQMEQIEATERFFEDPSALLSGLVGEEDLLEEDDSELPDWPPGHLRFNCGQTSEVTAKHIALYEQIRDEQHQLRDKIEAAIRQMHSWMAAASGISMPGDRLMFPDNPDETDVPLQCFYVTDVSLDVDTESVVLCLDSQFAHFDEHGCYVCIRDGQVQSFGTWDDVFGDSDLNVDYDSLAGAAEGMVTPDDVPPSDAALQLQAVLDAVNAAYDKLAAALKTVDSEETAKAAAQTIRPQLEELQELKEGLDFLNDPDFLSTADPSVIAAIQAPDTTSMEAFLNEWSRVNQHPDWARHLQDVLSLFQGPL